MVKLTNVPTKKKNPPSANKYPSRYRINKND